MTGQRLKDLVLSDVYTAQAMGRARAADRGGAARRTSTRSVDIFLTAFG